MLLVSCASDTNKAKSENVFTTEDVGEMEVAPILDDEISDQLISEKLQDFYDLMALQNEHPEFMEEVSKQLKVYTNDSISNYKANDFTIIKNIKQLGRIVIVNDSVKKIKLSYEKSENNIKRIDTIYAIITNKSVTVDNEVLISNKVRFSKN